MTFEKAQGILWEQHGLRLLPVELHSDGERVGGAYALLEGERVLAVHGWWGWLFVEVTGEAPI